MPKTFLFETVFGVGNESCSTFWEEYEKYEDIFGQFLHSYDIFKFCESHYLWIWKLGLYSLKAYSKSCAACTVITSERWKIALKVGFNFVSSSCYRNVANALVLCNNLSSWETTSPSENIPVYYMTCCVDILSTFWKIFSDCACIISLELRKYVRDPNFKLNPYIWC